MDAESSTEPPRPRYPLERGWTRRQLVHELARKEVPRSKLAEKYRVYPSAITQFADRHAEEIREVERDIENEFAGLWIADKRNRLAELMTDVEQLNEVMADTLDPGPDEKPETTIARFANLTKMMKVKQSALRAAADELGAIPQRVDVSVDSRQTIRYEIAGVDMEALK